MASIPFTDLVDEEYIASLPPLRSHEHICTLRDLEQHYFNSPRPPKHAARKLHLPVNHPIRRQLWPFLINRYLGTSIESPSDREEAGSALPRAEDETPQPSPERQSLLVGQEWADRRLQPTYHLNARGQAIHLAVLHDLAVSRPHVVYAPHVWPLAALMLHYLRPRTALACMRALLDAAPDERVAQSKSLWRSRCLALEALLDTKSSTFLHWSLLNFPAIEEVGGGKSKGIGRRKGSVKQKQSDALAAWPIAVWFVPFECLVPIVDCFLAEGVKVLFRMGFVLWKLAQGKREEVEGDEDGEEGGSADLLKSVATAYPASKARALLKEAFKIRQLSRRQVEAAVRKAAKLCQDMETARLQASNGGVDIVDSLVMPCVLPGQRTFTAYSQVRAEFEARRFAAAVTAPTTTPGHVNVSNLASAAELDFLMQAVRDENIAQFSLPKVIFYTERDGSSLRSLYRLCGLHADTTGRPQTFILVATASREGLFGAFVTHRWSTGDRGFYGSGESFLFRLRPTPEVVYKWRISSGLEYFQQATESALEVGGGVGGGPPGLRLDAGLQSGQSGPSPTFGSECLVTAPTDRINVGRCRNDQDDGGGGTEYCSFNVAAVEVLGFVCSNSFLA
ncbi:TLD domain-containing protein 2 [Echinococcus granulosus]|uniref:TBC1 domain family 4 n=1 Tax=Echinococcus granulosus TaxID=6210 RepID=A0A068W9R2_ECHGR|nr:TLD domain-containing protein 2 [Echinococcus granulosus]CDS16395.1 TBC1 domain family 4 [Echinococcus granulosus]